MGPHGLLGTFVRKLSVAVATYLGLTLVLSLAGLFVVVHSFLPNEYAPTWPLAAMMLGGATLVATSRLMSFYLVALGAEAQVTLLNALGAVVFLAAAVPLTAVRSHIGVGIAFLIYAAVLTTGSAISLIRAHARRHGRKTGAASSLSRPR